MILLDGFFFSALLASYLVGNPRVKLEAWDNIFDQIDNLREGDKAIWGSASEEVEYGNHSALRIKIEMDAAHPQRRELGATGHGPVWQELKQAMYMMIRQWDPSLRDLYVNNWDRLDKPLRR